MSKMIKKLIFLTFALIMPFIANAGFLFLEWENDFPFHDDSDYTNGIKLEYQWGIYGVYVNQLMYSPYNIKNEEYVPGTHPYCGYLAIGGDVEINRRIRDGLWHLNYFEAEFGTIGKSSLAEYTQKGIHKIVGAHEPKGWEHQLHEEVEIQSSIWEGVGKTLLGEEERWNLRGDAEVGGMLGTAQVAGGVNIDLKFGYGNDYGSRYREINVRSKAGAGYGYLLLGFEGRWWAWNVFLDGNRDGDSVEVEKEIWTCAFKTGAGMKAGRFHMDLCAIFSTREYETQKECPAYASLRFGSDL